MCKVVVEESQKLKRILYFCFFEPIGPPSTEVRFASFLSGGITTMAVMNQPEKKLEKCISFHKGNTENSFNSARVSSVLLLRVVLIFSRAKQIQN